MRAVEIYIRQRKFYDARGIVDREFMAIGEHAQAYMHLFRLDAFAGDAAAMERDAAKLRGTMYEGMALEVRAAIAAQAGRLTEYRRLLDETVAIAERQGFDEWPRMVRWSRIVIEAVVGNTSAARTLAATVLASDRPPGKQLLDAGFGLVLSGDVAGAERALALLDRIELVTPRDGRLFSAILIRGDVLLGQGRLKEAEAQYQ